MSTELSPYGWASRYWNLPRWQGTVATEHDWPALLCLVPLLIEAGVTPLDVDAFFDDGIEGDIWHECALKARERLAYSRLVLGIVPHLMVYALVKHRYSVFERSDEFFTIAELETVLTSCGYAS